MDTFDHGSALDPIERAKLLERTHEAVFSGARNPAKPRTVVYESWQRSLAARIDPNRWEPPVVYAEDELRQARGSHPFAPCLPMLRRTLLGATDETAHVMILTDAEGRILWREGHPRVRRAADGVLLAEGTHWSENAIGTNAMGTTLATGTPVQIHSAEHLVRTYHRWTCAASPVHDPETGQLVGAIDISGPVHTMHPALLALVSAAAQLVETDLRQRAIALNERVRMRNLHHLAALHGEPGALLGPDGRVLATEPSGLSLPERINLDSPQWPRIVVDGTNMLAEPLAEGYLLRTEQIAGAVAAPARPTMRFMGDGPPSVQVDGYEHQLTLRHAEILTILALRPCGVTGDQLALQLHGERGNPATVRVEMHRLRTQLSSLVAHTKPYRLAAEVDADFRSLRKTLRTGNVPSALALHKTGLLPRSESPAVEAERLELLTTLRRTVLESGNAEWLWEFANSTCGDDDPEVWERLADDLPTQDFRRAAVQARLDRLWCQED